MIKPHANYRAKGHLLRKFKVFFTKVFYIHSQTYHLISSSVAAEAEALSFLQDQEPPQQKRRQLLPAHVSRG